MAYVYILKSLKYRKLYVGSTTDLTRRLVEHNSGLSNYTKLYMPWTLIYKEEFINVSDARKREKYFKSCAGRKFIRNKIAILKKE